MSLEPPESLRSVHALLDYGWVQANESLMFAEAEFWRAFAIALREIAEGADFVARDVAANNEADAIDAFDRAWQGEHPNFERGARSAELIGDLWYSGGAAVASTKMELLGVLFATAKRIVRARRMTVVTLGASEQDVLAAVTEGKAAVLTAKRSLRRITEEKLTGTMRHAVEDLLLNIQPAGGAGTQNPTTGPAST